MVPKELKMENFGPFLNETVDFEKLQSSPLFLISGKTGAGKTTIFDAITFALFGDPSGDLRSAEEIRSIFAKSTDLTRVVFTFVHHGRTYQIERQPKQTIAKKNGKGNTIKNQKVQLTIFDENNREIESYQKIDRVREFLSQLLHLEKEQFRQIVMLPQGEFRNFLMANSTEKESLLRNIFGTGFYRRFTEKLKQKRQAYDQEVAETMVLIDQLFEQIESEKGLSYQESLNNTHLYLTIEKKKLSDQEISLTRLQKEVIEKQTIFNEAQQLAAYFKEYHQTKVVLAEQNQELPEIAAIKEQLIIAETIEKIQPFMDEEIKQQSILKALREEFINNTNEIEKVETQQATWETTEATLQLETEEWKERQQQLQRLENILPLLEQQHTLQTEQSELLTKQQSKADELEKFKLERQQRQEKIANLKEKLRSEKEFQERRYQEVQFQTICTELTRKRQREFELQELEEDQQIELAKLIEKTSRLSNQMTSATAEFQQIQHRWASLEIARLSMQLIPGEACPVCGSPEHPNPAKHAEISLIELQALQIEMEEKEAVLKNLQIEKEKTQVVFENQRVSFKKLQAERQQIQEQLLEEETDFLKELTAFYQISISQVEMEDFLAKKITETTTQLAELKKIAEEVAELSFTEKDLELQEQTLVNQLAEITAALQLLEGRLAVLNEQTDDWQLEELIEKITIEKQAVSGYLSKIESHQKMGQELKTQVTLLTERKKQLDQSITNQEIQLAEKTAIVNDGLRQADLMREAFNSLIEKNYVAADLKARIQDFENRRLILQDRIKVLSNRLENQREPELEILAVALKTIQDRLEEARKIYYQLENHIRQQQQLVDKIEILHAESQQQLSEQQEISQLFNVMNGDNPKKIGLERYVLKWYLYEVLAKANQQFTLLTNNRYQFELNETVGSYKGSTGLEINVYDDHAGQVRSAQTLSGGESFIAALSLALGLAEVIQNQAGGVAIETLFIDEGFGSLDEEALEMAMTALESVDNKGRMIGIISHVKELKERIPQQIIVKTNGSGQSKITYQLEERSEVR